MVLLMLGCVGGSATINPTPAKTETGKGCPSNSDGVVQNHGKDYCKFSNVDKDGNPTATYLSVESYSDLSKIDSWVVGTNEDGKMIEHHTQAGKPTETYVDGVLQT